MALKVDYVVKEAAINLRRNLTLSFATVITIAISLTLVGTSLLMRQGVARSNVKFSRRWERTTSSATAAIAAAPTPASTSVVSVVPTKATQRRTSSAHHTRSETILRIRCEGCRLAAASNGYSSRGSVASNSSKSFASL